MKYKAGDKVKIRQWQALLRDKEVSAEGVFLYIKEYCGQVATIMGVFGENLYKIDLDDENNWWYSYYFEGYAFKYGEEIEVSDDGKDWCKRIYVGYIDGAEYPYVCVSGSHKENFRNGEKYLSNKWRYARPIQKKHTIIIDGKEIEISEESYQKLKESLK